MAKHARGGPALGRRLKRTITVVLVSALLTLAGLRGLGLWRHRGQALDAGERRATNLALILSEYLRGRFEATDASLRQLAIHGQAIGGLHASPQEWTNMLSSAKAGLTGIGALSVVDAEGTIRHSTMAAIIGQPRRDQYVFQRLASDPRDVLVADTPLRTAVGPRTVILPLGRRLARADGSFDGAIVASFFPSELRGFFQTVDVGGKGTVWVFHPSGLVLFREPSLTDPIGESALGNPIFEAAREKGSGSLRGPLRDGGPNALSAFHDIPIPRLMVAVSLDEGEVLADWWREVAVFAGALAALGLGVTGVLVLLFRQIDARAEAEQALSRAQRLEALGQLTGGVAHDFNNLLTVIVGNVHRLRKRPDEASTEQALGQIEQTAQIAADLTRRLLLFARRQPLQPEIVDLREIVRTLSPMLPQLLGEGVVVKVNRATTPCLASVDAVQVETAVMNLCVNARDAMPQGGLLTIDTRTEALAGRDARRNAELAPGRYVVISVADTGMGVLPENLTRVFEPFFTTKEMGKGTGLGLSTVYGFARESGGDVRIESEVSRGTRVTLLFPEAKGVVSSSATAPPKTEARGAGQTILLVEDQAAVRELAAEMLRELGYRVVTAPDGPTALTEARGLAQIDLLLTDVMLPRGMNGRQLADDLAREKPGLAVLYSSGYSPDVIEHRGQVEPGLRLLMKPYLLDELARAVQAALREGRGGDH